MAYSSYKAYTGKRPISPTRRFIQFFAGFTSGLLMTGAFAVPLLAGRLL